MPLISVTRLRIRSPRFLPAFLWHTLQSFVQAKRAPGILRIELLRDANRVFWTKTAWRDEAAMRAYMLSGAHKQAMPKRLDWCDEASVVHWTQDAPALPGWQEAHQRMVGEGRPSKVRHPSPAPEAFQVAAPRA